MWIQKLVLSTCALFWLHFHGLCPQWHPPLALAPQVRAGYWECGTQHANGLAQNRLNTDVQMGVFGLPGWASQSVAWQCVLLPGSADRCACWTMQPLLLNVQWLLLSEAKELQYMEAQVGHYLPEVLPPFLLQVQVAMPSVFHCVTAGARQGLVHHAETRADHQMTANRQQYELAASHQRISLLQNGEWRPWYESVRKPKQPVPETEKNLLKEVCSDCSYPPANKGKTPQEKVVICSIEPFCHVSGHAQRRVWLHYGPCTW